VGGGGFITGLVGFKMYDSDSPSPKPFLRFRSTGTSNAVLETSANGFASVTSYGASAIAQPSSPAEYVLRVKIHPTLGQIWWYINTGLWFATPQGDTTGLCVGSPSQVIYGAPNSNGDSYISEVLATSADDPCVGLDVSTIIATANGASTGWNGDVLDINEIVKNQSTLLSTGATGVDSTFVASDIAALTGTNIVRGIVLSGEYSAPDPAAPQQIAGLLRIGGVNYDSAFQTVSNVLDNYQFIFEESPANPGNPLTESEVNNLEIGMRSG